MAHVGSRTALGFSRVSISLEGRLDDHSATFPPSSITRLILRSTLLELSVSPLFFFFRPAEAMVRLERDCRSYTRSRLVLPSLQLLVVFIPLWVLG